MRRQGEAVKLLAIHCINGLLTETDISVEKHSDLKSGSRHQLVPQQTFLSEPLKLGIERQPSAQDSLPS